MHWLWGLVHRMKRLAGRNRLEDELDEEIKFHLEREVEKNLRSGMSEADARRQAQLRFGGVENIKEQVRDESGVRWIEDTYQDLRFGLRGLRKTPVFTLAVLLSLGVGIGANTAAFSVVNGILLRPLPYPKQENLHWLNVQWPTFKGPLSDADYLLLNETDESPLVIMGYGTYGFTLSTPDGPQVVEGGAWTTATMNEVFATAPIIGRPFRPDDESVVLVSHRFWQSRMGGVADPVGQTLDLDDQRHTVIGVMPPGFRLPEQTEGGLWAVRPINEPTRRGPFYIRTVVRAADGITPEVAGMQLQSVAAVVQNRFPQSSGEWSYSLRSLKQVVVGDVSTTLTALSAVVACVLLISIANVINLLLAKGTARVHEVAMRSALGATRGRLVRQLLTESAILGVLGAMAGLGMALVVTNMLVAGGSSLVPRLDEVTLDGSVLAFALTLGVVSGLIAGAVPALGLRRTTLGSLLREGGRGGTPSSRRGGVRNTLIVAEFALALMVLVCSALLVKSLVRLQTADLGIDGQNVVTFRLVLPADPYGQQQEAEAFFAQLEPRLEAIPGVTHVGVASSLPPAHLTMTNNYTVEGEEPEPGESQPTAEWIIADGEYFAALQIPLLSGRMFTDADRSEQPGVVVVNEAFVRQHFPDRNPIGARLKSGNWIPEDPWLTIVGVVGDVTYAAGAAGGMVPTIYAAHRQNIGWRSPFIVLRTAGGGETALAAARNEVAAMEPRMPLRNVARMETLIRDSTAADRFRSMIFSVLAAVALVMAATGIYGVISYHVGTRQRETAIRRALGARTTRVVASVLGQGVKLVLIGAIPGLLGAYVLARLFGTLLFGVSPIDVTIYAGAAFVLTTVAALACLVPGIRAIRVDPVSALREE